MKSKIIVFALTMVMLFSLSSFSIVSESAKNAPTDLTPRVDGKKVAIEKILSSKTGQWLLKKIQKRHNKLSIKLATAEKAGNLKKIERIKSKIKSRNEFGNPTGIVYGIIGIIMVVLGVVLGDSTGLIILIIGMLLWIIGVIYIYS